MLKKIRKWLFTVCGCDQVKVLRLTSTQLKPKLFKKIVVKKIAAWKIMTRFR